MNRFFFISILFTACSSAQKKTDGAQSSTEPASDGDAHDSSTPGSDDSSEPVDSGDPAISECETGRNAVPLSDLTCMRQAPCVWEGTQNQGSRGYAIDVGGDINGDGWPDMLVGAPTEDIIVDDTIIGTDSGAIHIWTNAGKAAESSPLATLFGPVPGAYTGYSVAIVPDINGDGLDDILAGGRGTNALGVLAGGSAMLVLGRSDGWESDSLTADRTWSGSSPYSRAGSHVRGSEDINGDGLGDLLIATHQKQLNSSDYETTSSGRVAIIFGAASVDELATLDEPDADIVGSGLRDAMGTSFSTGDVDGDGHIDIIVGSPLGNSNAGRVDIIRGQSTPPSGRYTSELVHLSLSGSLGSNFGYTLAVGDLNGDGAADLAIGAPTDDLQYDSSGSVSIYTGGASIFEGEPSPSSQIHGEFDDHQLGLGLHAGADLDGDGIGDLVVGATHAWRGLITKGGRVYGFHGPHTDWSTSINANSAPIQIFGAATKDYLGRANVAADINSDGKAELFMGTGFSNGTSTYDSGSVTMFWGE